MQHLFEARRQRDSKRFIRDIDTIDHTHIENLIAHIAKSEFVITDSFHGMCLCIIFKKEFLAIVNKKRGETRFTSLVNQLGISDRLCYSLGEAKEKFISLKSINYDMVYKQLNKEKEYSINWLKNAIETEPEKKKPYTAYDVIDYRVDDLWRHTDLRCDELERKYQELLARVEREEKPIWNIARRTKRFLMRILRRD